MVLRHVTRVTPSPGAPPYRLGDGSWQQVGLVRRLLDWNLLAHPEGIGRSGTANVFSATGLSCPQFQFLEPASRRAPESAHVRSGRSSRARAWTCGRYHNRAQIDFSRPGKPTDNTYVQSLNGTLRMCLDVHSVHDFDGGSAHHRGLEAGVRRESPSPIPRGADAPRICKSDPSEWRFAKLTSCRKLTLKM